MESVGERLRHIREARQLSLQRLADLAGVSKGTRRGIVVRDGNPVGIGWALFRPKR